jgi:replication factor A1
MSADDIIGRITSTCPWISKDQVLSRLEKEKRKVGGLISDDALLKMIAAEFGCELAKTDAQMPLLLIKDLLPGLNDVTVTGRVLAIFGSKAFDGVKKGKLASLLIADKSGILRVVLWNEKTTVLETGEIKVGQLVRFAHGYTREDLGRKAELHVGEKCEIEKEPKDVDSKEYPGIRKFSIKIGQVPSTGGNKRVSLVGIVKKTFPASTFERKDLTQGKVMRFALEDNTGEISVVVWNEKAGELEDTLKVGDKLQIVNGKVKKAMGGNLEINIDARSYLGLISVFEEFSEIAELKEGMGIVNVEGEVATKPVVRNVRTSKGEVIKLATFELKDETGKIVVSAWRNHADAAVSLIQGMRVVIKNVYVKKGFSGDQPEISTRDDTSLVTTN